MINKSNNFNNIKTPMELLKYMDNITYGFIGRNGKKYTDMNSTDWNDWYDECLVQTGENVLITNIGTCYDQVEIERLWFHKNNYNFKTIFAWFEVDRENDFPTHTFLIYESNNKWYWFEHAWYDFKGIHEFNSEKEILNCFIKKHYEFVKQNHKDLLDSDKDKLKCYEYEKINKNLSVQEYFEHVTLHKVNI